MAMTGLRRMTVGLGLVHQPPPAEIRRRGLPGLFARVPPGLRDEAEELAHWAYGAAGGACFGALPPALRRQPWAGPAYGLATWVLFERVVTAALGLRPPEQRPLAERVMIAADHVLYGLVVADRPRDLPG